VQTRDDRTVLLVQNEKGGGESCETVSENGELLSEAASGEGGEMSFWNTMAKRALILAREDEWKKVGGIPELIAEEGTRKIIIYDMGDHYYIMGTHLGSPCFDGRLIKEEASNA
jgi:hypothetical protein